METMIIYSGVLSENIGIVQKIIETLFPENKTLLIEENNALRSDGKIFEGSVQPFHYFETFTEFQVSGSLVGPEEYFDQFLEDFIIECNKNKIPYDIEFEGNVNSKFFKKKIAHPDFYRLILISKWIGES